MIQQKREFELIKVQREEALRIRRNKEIERRLNQKKEREQRDKITQSKLLSKYYAKSYLNKLKEHTITQLKQEGYFNQTNDIMLNNFSCKEIYPFCEKVHKQTSTYRLIFSNLDMNLNKKERLTHGIIMNQVFKEREENKIKEEKEKIESDILAEKAKKEKEESKELKRINKFTNIINETIIKTKYDKLDLSNTPLADIDELSISGGMIHTIGGQFGEFIIAIQSLKEVLIDKYSQILDMNFNLEDFIYKLIVNFLKGLKDNEVITLKYLESQRYDFSNIPDEEEKRKEFKNFLVDEKRFYNKSIKILINHGLIDKSFYEVIINKFADIYFRNNIDINNPDVQLEINPQPENQDQIYLDSVKIKSEEILKENQLYEKLKKKIKFVFIKPEILKKKKNNYIGLITVDPVLDTYEKYTEELIEEVEEIHQIENIISDDNEIKENNEINENMENIENMENNDNNKEIQAQEKDTKNITKEIKQECKLTILYVYIYSTTKRT